MHINCTWFSDSFNVELSSQPGREPFLTIKACRIKEGRNGEFVSWPANPPKEQGGKWWAHVFASEAFSQAVLEKALESKPKQDTRTHSERKARQDDGPPF